MAKRKATSRREQTPKDRAQSRAHYEHRRSLAAQAGAVPSAKRYDRSQSRNLAQRGIFQED